MLMNSYPGQPLPPPTLYDRVGQSAYNLGSFGPPTDCSASYDRLYSALSSPPHGTQALPNAIGQSRYNLELSGPGADHPEPYTGRSNITPDRLATEAGLSRYIYIGQSAA